MSDIYVVVWEVAYEGQQVCGAYLTLGEAESRIMQIAQQNDVDLEGLGWIRCEAGLPVQAGHGVDLWSIWNTPDPFLAETSDTPGQ